MEGGRGWKHTRTRKTCRHERDYMCADSSICCTGQLTVRERKLLQLGELPDTRRDAACPSMNENMKHNAC